MPSAAKTWGPLVMHSSCSLEAMSNVCSFLLPPADAPVCHACVQPYAKPADRTAYASCLHSGHAQRALHS